MAYQNVGTPRFYVNIPEWLDSVEEYDFTGDFYNMDISHPFWRTLPVIPSNFDHSNHGNIFIPFNMDKAFVAILGHEFTQYGDNNWYRLNDSDNNLYDLTHVINGNQALSTPPLYNGFSISTFSYNADRVGIQFQGGQNSAKIGSIVIGSYYDMPHSPDLKLTMTREMDGVKRIRTRGGVDLVDHKYIKPAMWGNKAAAWELWSGDEALPSFELSRPGRRNWSLSFSFLSSSDIFPMLSSLYPYESTSADGTPYGDTTTWHEDNTLLDSDNFYSQVIHRTLAAGNLPFIFQPDNNNFNIDQYAICKFDQKSFQLKQVANGAYNMKLKIREVW